MTIGGQRECHRRVPESLGYDLGVLAVREEKCECGVSMPEVMQPDAR